MQKKTYNAPKLWALQLLTRENVLKGSTINTSGGGGDSGGGFTREKNPWGETSKGHGLWDE